MKRILISVIVLSCLTAVGIAGEKYDAPVGKANRVTFITEDNLVLAADFTLPPHRKGERAPIAILLHMYRMNRESYRPLIPHLTSAGFATLVLDLRGHGESLGPPEAKLADRVALREPKLFAAMHNDVQAAYSWLAENQSETIDLARFTLIGASVGCSIALDYASRDRSVDGIVCLTPGTNYLGLDSLRAARKYGERPILLMASEPEKAASVELGKLLPKSDMMIVPGNPPEPMDWHGTKMFGVVPEIEKKIAAFLIRAIGPPSENRVVASMTSDVYYPNTDSTSSRMNPKNRRWFSSPEEAESRGLRATKSRRKSAEPQPSAPVDGGNPRNRNERSSRRSGGS